MRTQWVWMLLLAGACSRQPDRGPAPVIPYSAPHASVEGASGVVSSKPSDSTRLGAAPEPSVSSGVVPLASASSSPTRVMLRVHLVPLGDIPDDTMVKAAAALRLHAPVCPVIETRRKLPAAAKSPRPRAYRADALLSWMLTLPIASDGKIMGVTGADIVTRKGKHAIWGILGMGSLDGRVAVVSTYRIRRRWEGGGASEAVVRDRLWKTLVHELGHTLGLEHCPNAGCVMQDGHGTVKTTDGEKELCPACRVRFLESIKRNASYVGGCE